MTSVTGCSSSASPDSAGGSGELVIDKMGIMYVGGDDPDGNGDYTDQAAVHYIMPKNASKGSVIMVPGANLTSAIYLSTPDQRNGWAYYFAKAGYNVYVFSPVGYNISNAGQTRIQAALDGEAPADQYIPSAFKWKKNAYWMRWGFGPEVDKPFSDGQFPYEQMDQFMKAMPLTFSLKEPGSRKSNYTADKNQEALLELIDMVGPTVLIGHSGGGVTVNKAAMEKLDKINAIVNIEPFGTGISANDARNNMKNIPYLHVFGDHFEVRQQQVGNRAKCQEIENAVKEAGGKAAGILLPDEGEKGNSHLMMIEKNNHVIADKMIKWLDQNMQ